MSLYGYVTNSPILLIDPFGLQSWQIWPWGGPFRRCPCKCKDVKWTFNPGGQQFQFGVLGGNRIGNDIQVVWTVYGDEGGCTIEHNERGFLVFNRLSPAGKQPVTGSVTGKDNTIPDSWKRYAGNGTITYTDNLGWHDMSSPVYDGDWNASISLDVELKCISEDGTSVAKKFKIERIQEIPFP